MTAKDVKSDMHYSDIPITRRQITHDPTAQAIDGLLVASCNLSPTATIDEAVTVLLQVGWESLPDCAIGACVPDGGGGQIIVRRSPRPSHSEAPDPTRLFPGFGHEHVIAIPYDEGSTLHIATSEEVRVDIALAPEASGFGAAATSASRPSSAAAGSSGVAPFGVVVDRLAHALGAAIRHCRSSERSLRDATEVRGLQAQIIQSEKLASLGQIAAGIVHELNNPLTSIVAYSDYLQRKVAKSGGDPQDVERLLRINEAAQRILRFSRDLVAYSRPSTEVPDAVVVREVIERALVFCEHVIGASGVSVATRFADLPAVRGVAGQLTQVFVNLVTNACQAMDKTTGRIEIATAFADNESAIVVTISDDGQGIDPAAMPRIFDPFFTTKTSGGTGLGLSIVRNIVTSHGGTIAATSAAPRGTTFQLVLPLAR